MSRCQATTRAGKPCKAPGTAGGLCFFHANLARARELGRIGGRKNRQQLPDPVAPTAITAAELSRLLTEALWDLRSNKLGPRTAAAMSQLAAVLNRTLPAADLEARVTRLEDRMAERAVADISDVTPRSTPQNGSTARDATEPREASDTPRTAAGDSMAEGAPAASDVELKASLAEGEKDVEGPKPIGKLE